MLNLQNIHPLTDFVRNTKDHVRRLKESKTPEVLTINGRAELIVQDAQSYQEILDRLERVELVESLREAMKSMDQGQGIPFDELESELNDRYGL